MKAVFMTENDYKSYMDGNEPLYYDTVQKLYEYEGDVAFIEVNIYEINLN